MRTVYKYELHLLNEETWRIEVPTLARVIHVDSQNSSPNWPVVTLWMELETSHPKERREFKVYGTGHPIEGTLSTHVGSVMDGPFVWHVYEVPQFGQEVPALED